MSECNNGFKMIREVAGFKLWLGLRGADGPEGPRGLPGPPGTSVELRGPVESTQDLPATASSSELWLVGAVAPYYGWFFNGSSWQNAGEIAVGPAGPDGQPGTTFTPSVSAAGVISWTNDGGEDNPDPVNIRGPQGPQGNAGTVFIPSVSAEGIISWTDPSGQYPSPQPRYIKGPRGETGPAGPTGAAAGFGTPTATVDQTTGTPSVTVTASGPDTAKVFAFAFSGIKGESGGGGGGTSNYNDLSNKPQIQGVTLSGNKTAEDLGLALSADVPTKTSDLTNDSGFITSSTGGLPAGGSANQFLMKSSGTDYAAQWTSVYSSATPNMDGTGSAGIASTFSRSDHVHPEDTTKQDKIIVSGILKSDGSGGVSAAVAGTDYLTPATAYSPVRFITATPYNISAADIGATVSCGYGMRNTPITVNLTQAASTTLPAGTEIAILNFFDSDITITVSGIQVGVPGIDGGGPTKLFYSSTSHSFKPGDIYSMLALKKISSDATYGDCWLLTGNVEVVT